MGEEFGVATADDGKSFPGVQESANGAGPYGGTSELKAECEPVDARVERVWSDDEDRREIHLNVRKIGRVGKNDSGR